MKVFVTGGAGYIGSVCTEELLNSRARDIDDMRLIGTLSAFVEYAQSH